MKREKADVVTLGVALSAYLVVSILMFTLLTWVMDIRVWSSLVVSLTFGLLFLTAIFPYSKVANECLSMKLVVYLFIMCLTLSVMFFYIISRGLTDTRCYCAEDFVRKG